LPPRVQSQCMKKNTTVIVDFWCLLIIAGLVVLCGFVPLGAKGDCCIETAQHGGESERARFGCEDIPNLQTPTTYTWQSSGGGHGRG